MRILIVEDELVSREKLKKILSPYGEVDATAAGPLAIEAFNAAWDDLSPYDLICLDINMPDMDGQEVLSFIREIENDRGVVGESRAKIVMITAQSDPQSVASSLKGGCDEYIVKPFNRVIIKEKIDRLFFPFERFKL